MPRMYSVGFKAVAVTAQQDLVEILAPTDAVIIIHEYELSQSTETGDAAEEQLQLTENRGVGSVTSGSGGTTATAQPVQDGEAAFGGTVEVNNTTKMAVGTGTLEELDAFCWNVRMPYQCTYLVDCRPTISPGNRWTLELEATPADSITMSGRFLIEELGG